MTSRKQQAIATKKLILETASRLTGERGFENITIQDICAGAGVSVGTFYHYFNSKEKIILEWYGLSDEYFAEEILPRLLAMDGDVFDRVKAFAWEQISFGMSYGVQNIRQLYRAQILHNNADFYSPHRGLVATMIALIRWGQEEGQLCKETPAETIAGEVLCVIRGVILDWTWGGTQEPQVKAGELAARYLQAYRV